MELSLPSPMNDFVPDSGLATVSGCSKTSLEYRLTGVVCGDDVAEVAALCVGDQLLSAPLVMNHDP